MDTCFLFTKEWNDEGCFCLKLAADGSVLSPLARQDFAFISNLQKDSKTWIVDSAEHSSIFSLPLPWLPEKKARLAIPFALEDQLAQHIDSLHFAFDKNGYKNKHYLVCVIDQQRMEHLLARVTTHNLNFQGITSTWFALAEEEALITDGELLINSTDFRGVLTADLAQTYLQQHPNIQPVVCSDSQLAGYKPLPEAEHSYLWIARGLQANKPLNFCQGEMRHKTAEDWLPLGYKIAAGLGGFWLLFILLINAWLLHGLHKRTAVVDKEIASLYYGFFPDATQVISPKFRIGELLKGQSSDATVHFWSVLDKFAKATAAGPWNIMELSYQNHSLSVTLMSPDFPSLERLEKTLKGMQLTVKQTQAANRDQQVKATLELQ